jgi:hypothetical protein
MICHRRAIRDRHFAFPRQLAEPLQIEDRYAVFLY